MSTHSGLLHEEPIVTRREGAGAQDFFAVLFFLTAFLLVVDFFTAADLRVLLPLALALPLPR